MFESRNNNINIPLLLINEDIEFFPLMSNEEEEELKREKLPHVLPILPLRNTVLFPGVIIPITVGRNKSIKLIKDAYKDRKPIGVISQKNIKAEDPHIKDLNSVGTVASILKMLQMPDGSITIIIQGKKKFKVKSEISTDPYLQAQIEEFIEVDVKMVDKELNAWITSVKDLALQIIKKTPNIPSEASISIKNIENTTFLINFISSNMNVSVDKKQKLLEINNLKDHAKMVFEYLSQELQMLELKNQIQSKVRTDIDKQQREYFLNQQLKTIQDELGYSSSDDEIQKIIKKSKKKNWSSYQKEYFSREIYKLKRMNQSSAEYSVLYNYLDLLVDLPWNTFTKDNFDLKKAKKILDKDHYGLDDLKNRILEYIAVLKLKNDMKAPIICLVGPPGVGKTSMGQSIARAINRKYSRIALGGIRDESDIRGHRKTYIGAMPGRIIQSLRKIKCSNPVLLLDEIDKVGNDFRGDPASALLEVLDPEQNNAFYDHYIELEFDLSNILFIATANSISNIHPALEDRLEIIEINGYTTEEKIEIAQNHLIPKQLNIHGLNKKKIRFTKKIIEEIIEYYTRESGVRGLEKQLASLIRRKAKIIASDEKCTLGFKKEDIVNILGIRKFEKDLYENTNNYGVSIGLAWTSVGGDIIFIEASYSSGKGKLTLTGNLGEVMKESAIIALSYLKSKIANKLNIDISLFENSDIHVHVPAGAIPKDGPSAGITILTALASSLSKRKVKPKLAMTGEITLRGKVLPVGGIKEKILAAKRAGIQNIIMSIDNEKDVKEISSIYTKNLNFIYVKCIDEVIDCAIQ